MSKKWITFLVAAAIGALLLPTVALADCRVDVVNGLGMNDATTVAFVGDPVPLPIGDSITKLFENSAAGTAGPALAFTEPQLSVEGTFERVADVLVTDDNTIVTGQCFGKVGNTITLSINGVMTNPVTGAGVPTAPANVDVYDNAGIAGLGITASSSIAIGGGNTQQTVITLTVSHIGSAGDLLAGATGAAVRVKNLRFDATSIPGGAGAHANWSATANIGPGPCTTVNVCLTPGHVGNGAVALGNAGALNNTLSISLALVPGGQTNTSATGTQNAGSGLNTAGPAFTPSIKLATAPLFRKAGAACSTTVSGAGSYANALTVDTCASLVANDVATVATSFAFAMSGIPSGVTVTFPSTITNGGQAGATVAGTWVATATSRGGSPLAFTGATGSSSDVQVYDTTTPATAAGGVSPAIQMESADNADSGTAIGTAIAGTTNPNCTVSGGAVVSNNVLNNGGVGAPCDANPKIGVFVGNPSGQGRATMVSAMGRGVTSLFTGDDVAAAGVFPAYTGASRSILTSANISAVGTTTYFTITPVRTTLLYPYVTTAGGFNTGIAVVNTCTDANVFLNSSGTVKTSNTCTTAGPITFYFIGTTATGTAVNLSLSTDLANGGTAIPAANCPQAVNLDASGRLGPGKAFACGATGLLNLISGAPSTFTGYAIAVIAAPRGHGFSAQFNAAGAPYAANGALVINENATARFGIAAGTEGSQQ